METKIKIKWNKTNFEVSLSGLSTVAELKNRIAEQQGIEPERQKLILKGKFLADSVSTSTLAAGCTVTLLGTALSKAVAIKETKVDFIEDLTEEQKAELLRKKGEVLKFGLENLGNTCFFNSTLQCLGASKEFKEACKEAANKAPQNEAMLLRSMGDTYNQLDQASKYVTPTQLIAVLRSINPQYAEFQNGNYLQHDAEECWNFVLNQVKPFLKNDTMEEKFSENLIDELFGIEMVSTLKNVELPEETRSSKEMIFKLSCFVGKDTSNLEYGLKDTMKENVELFSDSLQRSAVWEKTNQVNRLPPYLTVNEIRFFWKKADDTYGSQDTKTKILKKIQLSAVLDIYDLCTDDTKKLLDVGRQREIAIKEQDNKFSSDNLEYFQGDGEKVPTGRYRLVSILTHKGLSSESGHYIGWTYSGNGKWCKFDDDFVSIHSEEDVLSKVAGGGMDDIAYILLFKRCEVPME